MSTKAIRVKALEAPPPGERVYIRRVVIDRQEYRGTRFYGGVHPERKLQPIPNGRGSRERQAARLADLSRRSFLALTTTVA